MAKNQCCGNKIDSFGMNENMEFSWHKVSGVAPVNTVAPTITGTFEVGETLTCSDGTWTGTEPITYSYQWYRGVTPIGADQNTYVAVYADIGQTITCQRTGTNAYGSATGISNGVVIIFNRLSHGLKWAVDTDNMTEVGTTTTLIDYFGNNNLSNPLATNQPLTVASVLNGKSILRFTTDDILVKDVANWFAGDTSGQITVVFKSNNSTLTPTIFGTCDFSSLRIWSIRVQLDKFRLLHNLGNTKTGNIIGTTNLGTATWYIATLTSDGLNNKMFLTALSETISSNTLNGTWLADLPTQRDNITLGGLKLNGGFGYTEADIYGAYYGDYSTDAAIVNLHDELKQMLGL